jgi:hypothetical protein
MSVYSGVSASETRDKHPMSYGIFFYNITIVYFNGGVQWWNKQKQVFFVLLRPQSKKGTTKKYDNINEKIHDYMIK